MGRGFFFKNKSKDNDVLDANDCSLESTNVGYIGCFGAPGGNCTDTGGNVEIVCRRPEISYINRVV